MKANCVEVDKREWDANGNEGRYVLRRDCTKFIVYTNSHVSVVLSLGAARAYYDLVSCHLSVGFYRSFNIIFSRRLQENGLR